MKFLGIDYGTKWVGVAYSEGVFSRGLTQFYTKEALAQLKNLIGKMEITKVIVGLPQGIISDKARDFGIQLGEEVHVEVTFWDETLTSVQSNENLIQNKSSRKRRQINNHKHAAALILDSYLEENKSKII